VGSASGRRVAEIRRVAKTTATRRSRPSRLHRQEAVRARSGGRRLRTRPPEYDGYTGVDEGHQRQRSDVEGGKVDEDVDASDDRTRIKTEHVTVNGDSSGRRRTTHVVRVGHRRTLHVDGVVGDEMRQRVEDAGEPDGRRHGAAHRPRPPKTPVQHGVIDGQVAFERDDRQYHHRADVVETLYEEQQLAQHLFTQNILTCNNFLLFLHIYLATDYLQAPLYLRT